MKIRLPKWAIPNEGMSEEELHFAIEASDVIDFLNRGFTRQQHVDCYREEYREQAGKEWDEVVARLARTQCSQSS